MPDAWDFLELPLGGDALHELLREGVEAAFASARHVGWWAKIGRLEVLRGFEGEDSTWTAVLRQFD